MRPSLFDERMVNFSVSQVRKLFCYSIISFQCYSGFEYLLSNNPVIENVDFTIHIIHMDILFGPIH